jgi:hypothetical protein
MIKKLYEISLETISNFYNNYNPLELVELPYGLIKDLLKYLSVKNLQNFESYLPDDKIDTNQLWHQHLKTIWNYMPDVTIYSKNYYKFRYFEQLFTNTRALEIDLSVKIDENNYIHILNLSLHLIEKYDIKKDRIEYTPIFTTKRNINKEVWDIQWNRYIKRLCLAQNVWHMIRDNDEFLKMSINNVNSLVLAGYPQANDIPALRFVIKLLIEGNTTTLILKFPHKILLKTIFILLKHVDKSDVNITTDDVKCSNYGSISLRNQIMKYGSRSVLWKSVNRRNTTRSYLSNFISNAHLTNRYTRPRPSYDFSLQNLTRNGNYDDDLDQRHDANRDSVSSLEYLNDEPIQPRLIPLHRSPQLKDDSDCDSNLNENGLFTIEEDLPAQSLDSKLIYSIPKKNKLRFLNSLEIHSVHHRSNIDLLGSSLLDMSFIENLTISYLNFYSKELEESLLKLILLDRLKSLSLNNVRFNNGAGGFVYRILTDRRNFEENKTSKKKLEILKLDLIKSQHFDTNNLLNISYNAPRKLFLKKLVWKETEFSYTLMKIIELVLNNSEYLEYLELKSIRLSTYLGLCINEISKSCKYLNEFRIKQFSFNQLNEFDYMLFLIEKNQLKVLQIESCEIFENYIESKKFENSLGLATNLETLSLLSIGLRDEALYKICDSFSRMRNYSLKSIDLSSNNLTISSIKKLCDTIKELRTNGKYFITHLKINGNACLTVSLMELKTSYLNIIFNF